MNGSPPSSASSGSSSTPAAFTSPSNTLLRSPSGNRVSHDPLTGPQRRDTLPNFGRANMDAGASAGLEDPRKRMSLPGNTFSAMGGWEGILAGESIGGASGSGSNGGKVRDVGDDSAAGEEESKRRQRAGVNAGLTSCEACRRGKRRCEPSPLVPPDHPDAAKLPCARCRRFAHECVRVKVQRRKGPAPVDLSILSDAVHGFVTGAITTTSSGGPGSGPGPSTNDAGRQGSVGSAGVASGMLGWYDGESRNGGAGKVVDGGYMGIQAVTGGSQHSGPSPTLPLLVSSPGLNAPPIPDNLDQVVNPTVVSTIIGLFFDYVYPLTPCLHRPTFLSQLAARHDRSDPIFFALVLTVLASTLVQVPRSLINLDKHEVENLARRCVRVARAKIGFVFEESVPVQLSFIVISYLEGIVHLFMGNNTAHVMCVANANQLALAMRLNEETSYEGLDPIESELRRRTYWLLFQADKSAACMRARTINLRLEDAASLRLPAEVDDDMITLTAISMQPSGRTPIIAGFNTVTNLFRILNDALLLQRRKAPPTVDSILADLQNVNELREKTVQVTRDVANPLRLNKTMDSRAASPADDWEAQLEARFLNFFDSAGDEMHTLNSFLVLQGNILVTQSVVRLVLLHSKEALLQQLAVITQMPVQGIGSLAGMQASEPAEDIACELLDGLNSLPVECVATNGPSLVQKVRFVAIQLMECSVSSSPTTARAQKLLMQFLSVLSVIEGMYTFGRDISAE